MAASDKQGRALRARLDWLNANFAGIVAACMVATITWTVFQIDPLGLGSASGAEAKRTFQRVLIAPFYRGAQDKITVVLIDDDYLKSVGHGWPLPYAYQGRLLETVLSHGPKAVFLDFLYSQRHSTEDVPANLLAPLRHRETPIVLAALAKIPSGGQVGTNCESDQPWSRDDAIDMNSIDPQLFDLHTATPASGFAKLSAAYMNWYGCGDRYPLYLAGNPRLKTPAFALYDLARSEQEGNPLDAAQFAEPMAVMWGAAQSPASANLHALEAGCNSEDGSGIGGAFKQALRTAAGIAGSGPRGIRLACPYTDVVTAKQLTQVIKSGAHTDDNPVHRLLKDRYVLIGASVSGIWDLVDSPVNGQIPGVFMHAMALDNLLHYQAGYVRSWSDWWEFALFLIVALALAVVHVRRKDRRGSDESTQRWRKGLAAIELLIWLGIAVALGYIGHPWAAVLCMIAGIGLDWLRSPMAVPALIAGTSCLGIELLLWSAPFWHWAPFNWFSLSTMILLVRKQLERLDAQSLQTEHKHFSIWRAAVERYQSSLKTREQGT